MAEYHVLGEGWETIVSDLAAVHEHLDMSEEILLFDSFFVFGVTVLSGPGPPHSRGF